MNTYSKGMRSVAALAAAAWVLALGALPCRAQAKEALNAAGLAVKWELISNAPRTSAAFTITNKSAAAFPAKGWRLYFTSVMGVDAGGVSGGAKIEHLNGDIYRLSPAEDSKALKPGASARVTYNCDGPVLNL